MAGGLYNASNGNSDLNLLHLNVTIGRSPFTQGDVIIDYSSPDSMVVQLFDLYNIPPVDCGKPTNITLNSLTLTNGSYAFSSMINNVNIVLNNVTIRDFHIIENVIWVQEDSQDWCGPNNPPTLTINDGRIHNCTGGQYSTLLGTWCELTINQTEFINNTAGIIVSKMTFSSSIVGSTFTGNNFVYLLEMGTSPPNSTISISNSSFINNIGNGEQYVSMLAITGGQWTITDTLFDGNTNVNQLIFLEVYNAMITGTTFTNNNITEKDDQFRDALPDAVNSRNIVLIKYVLECLKMRDSPLIPMGPFVRENRVDILQVLRQHKRLRNIQDPARRPDFNIRHLIGMTLDTLRFICDYLPRMVPLVKMEAAIRTGQLDIVQYVYNIEL
eukprot:gene3643-4181_t